MKYPEILEANREVILDADKIYPGQKIRIPEQGQSKRPLRLIISIST